MPPSWIPQVAREIRTSPHQVWFTTVVIDQCELNFRSDNRFAAGSIIRLAYGHTVKSLDDEYVATAQYTTKATVEASSSAVLVDFFPAREWTLPRVCVCPQGIQTGQK